MALLRDRASGIMDYLGGAIQEFRDPARAVANPMTDPRTLMTSQPRPAPLVTAQPSPMMPTAMPQPARVTPAQVAPSAQPQANASTNRLIGGQQAALGQGIMQEGMDREKMMRDAKIAKDVLESGDESLIERAKGYFGNRENMVRLALAFNSMRLTPDAGLAAVLGSELKDIRTLKVADKRANATLNALRQAGVPEKDLQVLANDPELLREYAKKFFAKDLQALPADQQAFENLIEGMSEADKEKARRIKAGLDPRAGSQFALDLNEIFARAAAQAGGAEKGKSEEERKQVQVQNNKTWNIWETAISGLEESLGNTPTGKIIGLLPAISSSQQIADQAIAIMAPVLKNIFRESGEGVFTDKDQQILIDMIPDRTSNPETIAYAIKMINDIVAAKLNQDIKVEVVPNTSAGSTVLRFDAQGNPIQ